MSAEHLPGDEGERGYSARSVRNGMIAGYSAGMCGVVVGHPLDSVKVLLQTDGGASSGGETPPPRSATGANATASSAGHGTTRMSFSTATNVSQPRPVKGTLSADATIPRNRLNASSRETAMGTRSLRALYAGATGPLLTVGALQSLNFAVYDSVRRALYQRQLRSENPSGLVSDARPNDYLRRDNLANVALSSFAAGASISVLTSPMMIVKTKQQLMVWGFREAIRDTYFGGTSKPSPGLGGLRNFYAGYGVHFACDAFGRSAYMFTYEWLKRKLAQGKGRDDRSSPSRGGASTEDLAVPERMLCAAAAGMACWAFVFPADAIRSKLYARSISARSSPTTTDGVDLAREMIRERGFLSLYRGMGITVARAGPVAAAILPVYDSVLAWVSS
ncbi:hypothetical protein ACHAWF_009915 [Thalassiosira exigua]